MSRLRLTAGFLTFVVSMGCLAQQGSRADAKKERDAFLKDHYWDNQADDWRPRPGARNAAPPSGVKSRTEVKADRDAFLDANTYYDACSCWKSNEGSDRPASEQTRQQRKAATQQFLKSYEWDNGTDTWVPKKPRTTK